MGGGGVRLLILGGTGDAAELARRVVEIPALEVRVSLAGRTRQPGEVSGLVRVGGFGGVAGLVDYLEAEKIDLLVDATHPFAAKISENAAVAAKQTGIRNLMLVRPGWEKLPGDDWYEVESVEAAAEMLPSLGKRVFLTIGRQQLDRFSHLHDTWFLMRSIDPPETQIPGGKLLCDRGPFSLDNEKQLLQKYQIDTLVSKNSGGDATYAKIIAARELGIKVIMIQRPPIPHGEKVTDVDAALKWLKEFP
ncbi:cobalt-precorrin-6A reductase [Calothrix sp. PCC 6303]|uniref:cobalt-precorrin-6A reductase n=1 Tax=Calothrix sp. PCC 6303 TaxID=1170562 RepID=UPI0002A01946|nr:precorrin-6A reductase [Calothrix sp. PCC 6303]